MMADKKTEKKTALLLLPQYLADDKNILRSIHVTKNEKGLKYDIKDLDALELRKYYHQLPNHSNPFCWYGRKVAFIFFETGYNSSPGCCQRSQFFHQASCTVIFNGW